MLRADAEAVLLRIKEELNVSSSSCSIHQCAQSEISVVCIESSSFYYSNGVFNDALVRLRDSPKDKLPFNVDADNICLSKSVGTYDSCRSNQNELKPGLGIVKIWSMPGLDSLPKKLDQDLSMTASSIVNSQTNSDPRFGELASCVGCNNLIVRMEVGEEKRKYFVHGIKGTPESILQSVLRSMPCFYTCAVISLKGTGKHWKGDYAAVFYDYVLSPAKCMK